MCTSLDFRTTKSLGMAVFEEFVELYSGDDSGTMTLHGWFPHATGISLLINLPPCLIAVDGQDVPDAFADSLENMGHSAFVVPPPITEGNARSAEALWRIAMKVGTRSTRSGVRAINDRVA